MNKRHYLPRYPHSICLQISLAFSLIGSAVFGAALNASVKQFTKNFVTTPEGPKLIGSPPQPHEYHVTDR